MENIRLLRYQSIRNLLALLLLTFFFMSVVLNLNQKLKIMAGHIFICSKRVFGIPEFTFYVPMQSGMELGLFLPVVPQNNFLRYKPCKLTNNSNCSKILGDVQPK